MCGRYALSVLIAFASLATGCNGCLVRGEAQLTKNQAVAIATEALQHAGYDVTKIGRESIRASYEMDSCSWGVIYTLYADRLPAGPVVMVNDRTHAASISPGM